MRLDYTNNFLRTWAATAVGGAGLVISGVKALKAHSADQAAKREGNAIKRPFYTVPAEDIQNRNIAEGQAGQGLSSAEKLYAGEQRERGLSSSVSALKQTGGGPNSLGQLNSIFDDSLKSQSAEDAQLHHQNIDFFTKANSEVAAQKGIQFGINELQPYESKLKEIQDRRIAAKTNENNAINEGLGSASAVATGVNSYLSTKNPATAKQPDYSKLTPYNRTFGLENTDATPGGSPAAGIGSIDPNSWNPAATIQLQDSSDNS